MPAALALIDALPDFSSAAPARSGLASTLYDPLRQAEDGSPPAWPEEPSRDTGADIAAAEAAISERLALEHQAALAALEARHAQEMEAVRQTLAEEAGRTIDQRFTEMEDQVTALAAEATARMLSLVLTEDLQKRSVAELERVIRAALDDRETVRIRLSGAPLLWEALKTGLGDKASHVDFSEAPGLDVSLSIDERLFETRLTEWSETLSGLIP